MEKLKKVHKQLDLKYNKIPAQNLKKILQYADIGNEIKKNKITITQQQLSLYHKQTKNQRQLVITIIQYVLYFLHPNLVLNLLSRNDKKIYIEIRHIGDIHIRHIILKIFSEEPSIGYGEDLSSEPFFLEKEFRIFTDKSLSRPCYPFLKILDSLLTFYRLDFDKEEGLHQFLNNDIFNVDVCKDLNQRKPSFKKIDTWQLSNNEIGLLSQIQSIFPKFQEPQNTQSINLHNLKELFPIIPDYDYDDF